MIRFKQNNSSSSTRRYRMSLRSHNGFPQCVALIDLLFLLLLFTAMSTQVIRISGIRVDLPQANAPQESVLGKLIVTVTSGEYENDYGSMYSCARSTLPVVNGENIYWFEKTYFNRNYCKYIFKVFGK